MSGRATPRTRPVPAHGTGWTGIDGELPRGPCGGTGRVPNMPELAEAGEDGGSC